MEPEKIEVDEVEETTVKTFKEEIDEAIKLLRQDIISLLSNDIGILDRHLSSLEDRCTKIELFLEDLSYKLKQASRAAQPTGGQHTE